MQTKLHTPGTATSRAARYGRFDQRGSAKSARCYTRFRMSIGEAKRRQVAGWAAVFISTLVACFWAFWGSNENFHEGWFSASIWQNIALMFVQYFSPMLIVILMSVLALRWPLFALPLLGMFAAGAILLFRVNAGVAILFAIFLLALGALYRFGRPQPRRWAWRCVIGLPLTTAVICGVYPGWLATHRLDDGNYGMRLIEGNGMRLVWAPEGAGWPSRGVSWQEARRSCAHLTADGRSLADQPQNVWRLPTVDEAIRSLVFRGVNAGGTWDRALHRAQFRTTPDKDSPLWKVHSPVIYWWAGDDVNGNQAYYISYNGYVLLAPKHIAPGDLAFRCVCEPSMQNMSPSNRQ